MLVCLEGQLARKEAYIESVAVGDAGDEEDACGRGGGEERWGRGARKKMLGSGNRV